MSADVQATQPRAFTMTSASKQWSSGICDCCQDSALCCYTCWCFPCFACQTAKEAGECLCLPLLDAFGLIPPMATSLRKRLQRLRVCELLRALHLVSDIQRDQDETKPGGVCQRGCLIRTNGPLPHQQPEKLTSRPSSERDGGQGVATLDWIKRDFHVSRNI
ncbi:uncharacterized protein LOC122820245 isoform X3 [Gambusia affinis]|nr:uncharacterized protein LOC122820245 isoform X3 [Gambusia affinis]XP_043953428.1 uncharacterized protein LOC122820245 isoform X3 [Gambusia affinis]XP_043953429.1 uncharacterized protein LOC122820245 isoform X3 [Gambusia affinis]XP_043953430.1 uncharacterized protein LOC122820245 isoform X3 [Gambusia affinis]XP_043953431.1 uncharacterized protein LOC122820245 isoform X3 [Gambusia affinis]XP_043953432.1 uncharacterized protein LOC122820245 isoform X3 [Gambusia affinis]XP_043953433.1 uncharac